MMKKLFAAVCLALLVLSSAWNTLQACTSIIVASKASANCRPMLWKQRDTDSEYNHLRYFNGERYSFTAIVDASDAPDYGEVWAGANSVGFAIINTKSYNVSPDSMANVSSDNGILMREALGCCATLAEFEAFLAANQHFLKANYGVIDASGGAAYYEVWNNHFTKFDVAESKEGYMVRTNFSFSGNTDPADKSGYERFLTASALASEKYAAGKFDRGWFIDGAGRSFRHEVLGVDLATKRDFPSSGRTVDQDYIPRFSTASSMVIEGVNDPTEAANTVLWTAAGYTPCTYAVPVWVGAKSSIPKFMTAEQGGRAAVSELSFRLKHSVFPIEESNGEKYLFFARLFNEIMPSVRRAEQTELNEGGRIDDDMYLKGFDPVRVENYNRKAEKRFERFSQKMQPKTGQL